MDFNLAEHAKNGSTKSALLDVIVFSLSIVVGLYWKDYINKIIAIFYPDDIILEGVFGVVLTVLSIFIIQIVLKFNKPKQLKEGGWY